MPSRRPTRIAATLTVALLILSASPAAAAPTPAVQVTDASPYYAELCSADHVAFQEGYYGAPNYPDTEVEPTVAVNPTDGQNIVTAYQQDRWENGGSRGDVVSVSHDGGQTWTMVRVAGIAQCDGGQWPRGTDPWLSFGPNGLLYFVSQSFDDFNSVTAFEVATSTDGGDTWSAPVAVSYHPYGAPHYYYDDKVTLTADPNDATGNTAYLTWDRYSDSPAWYGNGDNWSKPKYQFNGGSASVFMSKTTDGGATWTEPGEIYRPGGNNYTTGPEIVVQPNGTLVLGVAAAFRSKKAGSQEFYTTYLVTRRSTDGGKTWSAATRGPRMFPSFIFDYVAWRWLRTGAGLMQMAMDPSTGRLYAVWDDGGNASGDAPDIRFSTSTTGKSWTSPISIDGSNAIAFTPAIAVAPNGKIGVTFSSWRNSSDEVSQWFAACSASCTAPGSWSQVQIGGATADGEFPMWTAPDAEGLFLGDYEGLAANADGFHAAYVLPLATGPSDPPLVGTNVWYSFIPIGG